MIDASEMQRGKVGSRRGGILGWLAIVFLLVLGCLITCGVFVAHSIRVHENRSGHDVQVETPFGSIHVDHRDNGRPESTGLPLYPGAKLRHNNESASIDLSEIFGQKDLHIVAGKWETSDPISKVRKFYQDKFPEMSVIENDGKVEMHSADRHNKRVIVLRSHDGATEISLASIGEPKAN